MIESDSLGRKLEARTRADMGNAQTHFEVPDSWGLTGKVAIVTGGGAAGDGLGNGRAPAILLARAGTRGIVVDRDVALAKRTAEMIEAARGPGPRLPDLVAPPPPPPGPGR